MCTAASAVAQKSAAPKLKTVFEAVKNKQNGSKPATAVTKPDNLKIKY